MERFLLSTVETGICLYGLFTFRLAGYSKFDLLYLAGDDRSGLNLVQFALVMKFCSYSVVSTRAFPGAISPLVWVFICGERFSAVSSTS